MLFQIEDTSGKCNIFGKGHGKREKTGKHLSESCVFTSIIDFVVAICYKLLCAGFSLLN